MKPRKTGVEAASELPAPPAWAKGFAVAFLKDRARLFARTKSFAFGTFSLPRESEIALALAGGRAAWTRDGAALAIFRVPTKPIVLEGFAGSSIRIPPGSVLVTHFGFATRAAALSLLVKLQAKASPRLVLVRRFSEDRELADLLIEAGLGRDVLRVVEASSDLRTWSMTDDVLLEERAVEEIDLVTLRHLVAPSKGEDPFLAADELAAVRAEVDAWLASRPFAQHYSSYNKGRKWTAIALRGFFDDPDRIEKPTEMHRNWKLEHAAELANPVRWTEAAAVFEKTRKLVERLFPYKLERVRIMRLAPGELLRHADITDRAAGTSDGAIARLHAPIVTNPSVRFRSWELDGTVRELVPEAGGLFYLDTRKPHAVKNDGTTDRIHIVVDAVVDRPLRMRIRTAWA